jgi:hypothetical protein
MSRTKLVEGEVFRSDAFVVTREAGGRLFRLTRTNVPLDEAGIEGGLGFFGRFLPLPMRARYVMLLDSREAPMAEDRENERRVHEAGARILAGFARCAVLVKSAAGKLQASRLTRDNVRVPVFVDEDEALGYLLAELSFG